MITIDQKIVSAKIARDESRTFKLAEREEILSGKTYKVKSPLSEFSMYITMNDIEIDGKLYPFEIFINSKSLENQQWVIAITRLISSIFRQSISSGADVKFIVKELKSVFDPNGGYRKSKGIIMPSLVAEIAYVIERHLIKIGIITVNEDKTDMFPMIKELDIKNLRQCPECGSLSVYRDSGCDICSNCAYSKCG